MVAPNGDVLAVRSFRTTNTYVPNQAQAAFFSGGHWGSPITISSNVYGNVNSFGLPGIGFDSHSQATLIWEQITNPSPVSCALKAVTGNAASGFGSSQTISNAATCYGLAKLAVNSGGEAVVVEGATGILTGAVIAISRSLTGTWGTPVTVAASVYRQNNPNVGLGNDGIAVTVWRTRSGVSYAVRSGGTWSAAAPLPVLVGQAGGVIGVAVDGSGNAVAIFTQVTLSPGTYATYRPVGGTWQTKVQLSSNVAVAATPCRNIRRLRDHGIHSPGWKFQLDDTHVLRIRHRQRWTRYSHRARRTSGERLECRGPVINLLANRPPHFGRGLPIAAFSFPLSQS